MDLRATIFQLNLFIFSSRGYKESFSASIVWSTWALVNISFFAVEVSLVRVLTFD